LGAGKRAGGLAPDWLLGWISTAPPPLPAKERKALARHRGPKRVCHDRRRHPLSEAQHPGGKRETKYNQSLIAPPPPPPTTTTTTTTTATTTTPPPPPPTTTTTTTVRIATVSAKTEQQERRHCAIVCLRMGGAGHRLLWSVPRNEAEERPTGHIDENRSICPTQRTEGSLFLPPSYLPMNVMVTSPLVRTPPDRGVRHTSVSVLLGGGGENGRARKGVMARRPSFGPSGTPIPPPTPAHRARVRALASFRQWMPCSTRDNSWRWMGGGMGWGGGGAGLAAGAGGADGRSCEHRGVRGR